MSEFSELKATYKELTGKNAPPMSAEALRAKVEELKASPPAAPAAQGNQGQAGEQGNALAEGIAPSAGSDPIQHAGPSAQASAPPAAAQDPVQSVEDAAAELGLTIEEDGHCLIEMLTGLSGPDTMLVKGDAHRCHAAEAIRLVQAGFAQPR